MPRAVFLDRDGVLNKAFVRGGKVLSPDTVDEMIIVPDAPAALDALRRAGYRLVLVTNQPDVARGRITAATVNAMNAKLTHYMHLDAIEVCMHDDADRCDCRKPKPGMLLHAAKRDGISLDESFMIGDRERDLEAGRRAGCRTVLIGNAYGATLGQAPDAVFETLTEAADWIIGLSCENAQAIGTPHVRD